MKTCRECIEDSGCYLVVCIVLGVVADQLIGGGWVAATVLLFAGFYLGVGVVSCIDLYRERAEERKERRRAYLRRLGEKVK